MRTSLHIFLNVFIMFTIAVALWMVERFQLIFGRTSQEVGKNFLMILTIWLVLSALGVLLGGCVPSIAPHSGAANAVIDQTITNTVKDIKDANDRFRVIASEANCAVTLGSFGREQDLLKSWGMLALCPEAMSKMSALTTGVPMPSIPRFPAPSPSAGTLPDAALSTLGP